MPDGGKEVYGQSDGATVFPRHLLLSQVVDAQGNTTTLNYDTQHRLTSVVDAMGRSTTRTLCFLPSAQSRSMPSISGSKCSLK
jgi:YD repeat-containing protein